MILNKNIRRWAMAAFLMYILCLIWIITFKCNMIQPVVESRYTMEQLSLTERILKFTSHFARTTNKELVINILLFIPLGLVSPLLFKERQYLSTALMGLVISLAFEISQLLNCIGGFTYIDIYCNTFGAILGTMLHFFARDKVKEKYIETALKACAYLAALLAIFGAFNTVKNFDIYITENLEKYL